MSTTHRRSRRTLRILGRCLLVLAVYEVGAIVVFRSRWRPAIDAIRRFNKKILNPAMIRLAGKRHWYASAVHHVGRTSGTPYVTPVWAERVGRTLLVPLPYGEDVDWCRNILSAGSCVVEARGVRYEAGSPAIVPAEIAANELPWRPRVRYGVFGVDAYLRLSLEPGTPAMAG